MLVGAVVGFAVTLTTGSAVLGIAAARRWRAWAWRSSSAC